MDIFALRRILPALMIWCCADSAELEKAQPRAPRVSAAHTSPRDAAEPGERVAQRPNKLNLPAVEHIEAMTAEAYSHVLGPIVKDLPLFEIPKKYHAELLDHFRNAEIDEKPKEERGELGSIRLSLVGGTSRRICWFWKGHKGRMYFSYAGMRYVTSGTKFDEDETLEFDGHVRLIKRELEKAEESKR